MTATSPHRMQARADGAAPATAPPLEEPSVTAHPADEARASGSADLYRDLPVIQVLAARDFKVKYKQSLLGPLWLVFQPLALLAAFLVAFRGLADVQAGVPYTVFALVGLSVWAFFQAAMTIGAASLVSNVTLVRFTPCPRLAFPIAGILASLPAWAVDHRGSARRGRGHRHALAQGGPLAARAGVALPAHVGPRGHRGGVHRALPGHALGPAVPASGGRVPRAGRLPAVRAELHGSRS